MGPTFFGDASLRQIVASIRMFYMAYTGSRRARSPVWTWHEDRKRDRRQPKNRTGKPTLTNASLAIRVYTICMKIVKVRRVGNSNVISIPREFEARGYAPGSSVLVEELPGGELRVMSTEKVRDHIRDIGQRLVAEHGEALEILANHDPDAPRQ